MTRKFGHQVPVTLRWLSSDLITILGDEKIYMKKFIGRQREIAELNDLIGKRANTSDTPPTLALCA